ncbi:MAG: hypothetical protein QOI61_2636 [Actinomycetota bacterium]|jgi:CubicO group peptidase (beta-lactamase class C family)
MGISRRTRLSLLAGLTLATLFWPIAAGRLPIAAAVTYEAYHDASGATHQANFDRLADAGYRMTSLSMYGTTAAPLYAAVWVKKTGPAWSAIHGVSVTEYNNWIKPLNDQGYRLRQFAVVGDTLSTGKFSAVAEKVNDQSYLTPTMDGASYRTAMDSALSKGYIPSAIAWFGTAAKPQVMVAFRPNSKGVWGTGTGALPWSFSLSLTAATLQEQFNAQTGAGVRPSMVVQSPVTGLYDAVWQDTVVNGWSSSSGMTSAQYQTAFSDAKARGAYPIFLHANGAGSNSRFSAIFAPSDALMGRVMRMTGTTDTALAGFDAYMQKLMKEINARAGQLAVAKDGKLLYARGFTWAESGYPQTTATNLFRTASCSKPLTAIGIHQLMTPPPRGIAPLSGTTKITDVLSVTQPNGSAPADSRWKDITVDQLLVHGGGWDSGVTTDPQFNDVNVSALAGAGLPVTKAQILKHTATVGLNFTPGTQYKYSNFGFSLLGQAIEKKRGKDYISAIKDTVFTPLGVTRPILGRSLIANRAPGEVRYHSAVPTPAQSVMSTSRPWVANAYGSYNHENFDAHGGWSMAAPDWAKVLASFSRGPSGNPILTQAMTDRMFTQAIPTIRSDALRGWYTVGLKDKAGNAVTGYHHNGWIRGSMCAVMHTTNNLDFVVLVNTDSSRNLSGWTDGPLLMDAANKVTTWPTTDLFPSMGIKSFS